jgi:hypothetical protein
MQAGKHAGFDEKLFIAVFIAAFPQLCGKSNLGTIIFISS